MKKLEWISDTIMNTSVFEYFDVYISVGVKAALSAHGLGKI